MGQYLPIFTLSVLILLFVVFSFVASQILAPRRPTEAKEAPYECGIVPTEEPPERFPVRFYLVAMIFIIFDIEVVFLYPWAVTYHQLGTFGLGEMAAFVLVVFVAFAYLVSNGALDWGPGKRLAARDAGALGQPTPGRTVTSTIRRVPRPEQLVDGPAPRPVAPLTPEPVPTPAGSSTGGPSES